MYAEKFESFWNSPSLELAEKIFSENTSYTFQGFYFKGPQDIVNHFLEVKKNYKVAYKAFDILEGPELAYHRWHATAVFDNEPMAGFAPTGKDVSYSGLVFLRIQDGRILEIVSYSDLYDVLGKDK